MAPPTVFAGPEKLVLSIDIGTTTSSISVAHLAPGTIPVVESITTHEQVPTEVLYNAHGGVVACGVDCRTSEMLERANAEGLHLSQFFKLSLHPATMQFAASVAPSSSQSTSASSSVPKSYLPTFEAPPLPPNVSIESIYASYMHYLCDLAAKYFASAHQDGADIWAKLWRKCEVVFATPDGWDERQQGVLRKALGEAGIVQAGVNDRVHFTREAEASVNYALKKDDVREWMKPGATFTVIDAGGSTVDICMYVCEAVTPKLLIREVKPSECIQAGGVFVDRASAAFLKQKLAGSKFGDASHIAEMVTRFEEKTKRKFTGNEGPNSTSIIHFGENSDSDASVGITMGRIKLAKPEIEQIFHFCVNEIVASVSQHVVLGETKATHLILTGGFGDSGYLQKCLKDAFPNLSLVTPAEEGKKVVADGCLLAFISELVAARAVRATLGVVGTHPYIPSRQDHLARRPTTDRDGFRFLDGCWSQIVQKGDIMRANEPYERYCYELIWPSEVSRLSHYSIDLWVNLNGGPQPDWAMDPAGRTLPGFHRRCTVSADVSPITRSLTRVGDQETGYVVVDFRVCLYLAQNTLRAKIKWFENRMEREGPAIVTFDEEPRAEGNLARVPAENMLRA